MTKKKAGGKTPVHVPEMYTQKTTGDKPPLPDPEKWVYWKIPYDIKVDTNFLTQVDSTPILDAILTIRNDIKILKYSLITLEQELDKVDKEEIKRLGGIKQVFKEYRAKMLAKVYEPEQVTEEEYRAWICAMKKKYDF